MYEHIHTKNVGNTFGVLQNIQIQMLYVYSREDDVTIVPALKNYVESCPQRPYRLPGTLSIYRHVCVCVNAYSCLFSGGNHRN